MTKSFTLITGASGFLGSNLLKILKKKKKLICLYNSRKIQNKNIISIKFDIKNRNYSFLRKYRISTLVHFLWPNMSNLQDKSHNLSILENQKFFLKKIIDSGCNNLIIAGSCYEYGKINKSLSESMQTRPDTYYGRAKNNLRKYVFSLKKKYNFKITWLRIFFVYGFHKEKKNITHQLFSNYKKGRVTKVNMSIKRDYLDIDKVSKIISKIIKIEKDIGIVNLSSGKSISLKSLVGLINKKYNINAKVSLVDSVQRNYELQDFYGCNKKLKRLLTNEKNTLL